MKAPSARPGLFCVPRVTSTVIALARKAIVSPHSFARVDYLEKPAITRSAC